MQETKALQDGREWLEDSPTPWPRKWIQQGRQEGLEEGLQRGVVSARRNLERLALARFGESAAQLVEVALEAIEDLDRLDEVAEWIATSDCAETLLARLRAS